MKPPLTAPGTWVYFLAETPAADFSEKISRLSGSKTEYDILEVAPIRGKISVSVEPGQRMVRIENSEPLERASSEVKFKGTVRHLQYTAEAVRTELQKISTPAFPASGTTAVLIPIRKNAEWWGLPQDKRQQYFEKKNGNRGHTAIGQDYASRIYRKLYHSRYMETNEPLDYDFLTYFEFPAKDRSVFQDLLGELRNTAVNPEWGFVDFELEIWMEKKNRGAEC